MTEITEMLADLPVSGHKPKPHQLVGWVKRLLMDDLFCQAWETAIDRPAYKHLTPSNYETLIRRGRWLLDSEDHEDLLAKLRILHENTQEVRDDYNSGVDILRVLDQ